MSNLTRGGLVPATLKNLATEEEIPFMFNPQEYSLTKTNTYEKRNVIGQNVPAVTFQQGGAISLSLKLHFDTAISSSDVRAHTNKLLKMMMIDTSSESQTTGKGAPPVIGFTWGRVYFKAVFTSMTQRFTLFKPDGTPMRCVVDVTMEQIADDAALTAQVQGATGSTTSSSTSSSSGTSGGGRSETSTQGDRIDHVAERGAGSSSSYREVAAQNNIENPLKISNGQQFKV